MAGDDLPIQQLPQKPLPKLLIKKESASQTQQDFESVFDTLKLMERREEGEGEVSRSFKWQDSKVLKTKVLHMKLEVPDQDQDILALKINKHPELVTFSKKPATIGLGNDQSHFIPGGSAADYSQIAIQNASLPTLGSNPVKQGWLYYFKQPTGSPNYHSSNQSSIVLDNDVYAKMIQSNRYYYVYRKGKLYQFMNEQSEVSQRMLDIRNCMIDLVTVQRPDQSTGLSGSCNLDHAIKISCLGQSFYLMSGLRSAQFNIVKERNGSQESSQSSSTPTRRRDQLQQWFNAMKQYCTMLNLRSYYEIGNLLGKGNFAKVYESTRLQKSSEKFAIKTIEKKVLSKNKRNFLALLQEVSLLRKLDHENIIKLIEVYESKNNIHLVLEHLNGGELFERIRQKGSYCENDAAVIMKCLLRALVAMHSKNIVHRDLKPENMLFKNDSIDSLKIVDFGLSASTKDGQLNMRCGSPGYVAPEILNDKGYGCKVDIFSAGIILYILLTGKFVFSGKNYKDILNKNTECIVPYPHQYWSRLSTQARDLVQNMLQKNPDLRLSAAQALQHPWFSQNNTVHQIPIQFNLEEVGDANLTDDEPSLSNTVNLHLITTSPIWNKTKMRETLKRVNQEQDKMITFQTPAPNPRFGGVKNDMNALLKLGQIGGTTTLGLQHRDTPPANQKMLNGGIVMQNLFENNGAPPISAEVNRNQNQSVPAKPAQQQFTNNHLQASPIQIEQDIKNANKKYMQTPQMYSNFRGQNHIFVSNTQKPPHQQQSNQQLKAAAQQQVFSANPSTDKLSTNITKNQNEEEKSSSVMNNNQLLFASFSLKSNIASQKIIEQPDYERALKKWQLNQGNGNSQLDQVPEDIADDVKHINNLNSNGGGGGRSVISQVKEVSKESSKLIPQQQEESKQQSPEHECLQKGMPTSGESSSISGPLDVEENINLTNSKPVVANFNAHSNNIILKKTSLVRMTSPLNFQLQSESDEGNIQQQEGLGSSVLTLLDSVEQQIDENVNSTKKPHQMLNNANNPMFLKPSQQISSILPINSRFNFQASGSLAINQQISHDAPISDQSNNDGLQRKKSTFYPKVSDSSSGNVPPPSSLGSNMPSSQVQALANNYGNHVHANKGQRLDTLGDDVDEGSDLVNNTFVVPTTPGGLQGGSRNLLKNSFTVKANQPLLKYISLAQNQQKQQQLLPQQQRLYSGLPQHHHNQLQQQVVNQHESNHGYIHHTHLRQELMSQIQNLQPRGAAIIGQKVSTRENMTLLSSNSSITPHFNAQQPLAFPQDYGHVPKNCNQLEKINHGQNQEATQIVVGHCIQASINSVNLEQQYQRIQGSPQVSQPGVLGSHNRLFTANFPDPQKAEAIITRPEYTMLYQHGGGIRAGQEPILECSVEESKDCHSDQIGREQVMVEQRSLTPKRHSAYQIVENLAPPPLQTINYNNIQHNPASYQGEAIVNKRGAPLTQQQLYQSRQHNSAGLNRSQNSYNQQSVSDDYHTAYQSFADIARNNSSMIPLLDQAHQNQQQQDHAIHGLASHLVGPVYFSAVPDISSNSGEGLGQIETQPLNLSNDQAIAVRMISRGLSSGNHHQPPPSDEVPPSSLELANNKQREISSLVFNRDSANISAAQYSQSYRLDDAAANFGNAPLSHKLGSLQQNVVSQKPQSNSSIKVNNLRKTLFSIS